MADENLAEEVKRLAHEVERLQAINEIQNIVAHYALVHCPSAEWMTPQLFAQKQPDVSVEIAMWGLFVGNDHVAQCYHGGVKPEEVRPGVMMEHQFTTPAIQVAGDGKTAKGVWFSPGHEIRMDKDGKIQANWCWGKYSGDFIKEDGKWKIWHFRFWDTFMTPYDEPWTESYQPAIGEQGHPGADKPCAYRSTYSVDRPRDPIPAWPAPYDTWDGKSVCADSQDLV